MESKINESPVLIQTSIVEAKKKSQAIWQTQKINPVAGIRFPIVYSGQNPRKCEPGLLESGCVDFSFGLWYNTMWPGAEKASICPLLSSCGVRDTWAARKKNRRFPHGPDAPLPGFFSDTVGKGMRI